MCTKAWCVFSGSISAAAFASFSVFDLVASSSCLCFSFFFFFGRNASHHFFFFFRSGSCFSSLFLFSSNMSSSFSSSTASQLSQPVLQLQCTLFSSSASADDEPLTWGTSPHGQDQHTKMHKKHLKEIHCERQ